MQNPRTLSDEKLLSETKRLVAEERRVSLEVLTHLREIDRRRLFAQFKCSSLHEYCTEVLKYSEPSAQRRIESARLLSECPELEPQIQAGSLNLSLLSRAQVFFRKEEIRDPDEKRAILKTLENQSCRKAERKLMSLMSEPEKHRPEKMRMISDTHSEIRITVDAELVAQIEELKNLLGESSVKEALAYAVKAALEKKRPKAPKTPSAAKPSAPIVSPPASEAPSHYITANDRRIVWARDQGQCTHRDSQSGRRCSSRFGLEIDHLRPYALGGSNHPDNLALKCRAHNQFSAIRSFGHEKMARFIPSLK